MKGRAIPFLVLAGLCLATCAMALDMNRRPVTTLPEATGGFELNALFQCDNNSPSSAYYQDPNGRYGNVFAFPAGSFLSSMQFVHFGFGFAGPYLYDVEVWDAASCTYVGGRNGLIAQNAATALRTENVDMTAANLCLNGEYIVAIHAHTCAAPDDCYPDVVYDDQFNVYCPVIIDAPNGVCIDVSAQSGPFLLRANTTECITDVRPSSWGKVKTLYR